MSQDLYEEIKNRYYYTPLVVKGQVDGYKTLNQYRVLKEIGKGAYSVVYLAEIGMLIRTG